MRKAPYVFLLSLPVVAPAVRAQTPVPVGGEFQVNTYTTDAQLAPFVAVDPGGGFVVVWDSNGSAGGDTSSRSIQGQRFAPDGGPIGAEFQVNTYTTDYQAYPSLAVRADGSFVIAWHSAGSGDGDTSSYSVHGRRYAANGDPIGDQFQVNSYTTSDQAFTSVAVGADGGFMVVWHSFGADNGDTESISVQGQLFDSSGDPVGGQLLINSYTTSAQNVPAVAASAEGAFVVVWRSGGSDKGDTSETSVQGRRFALSGDPLGDQFQVNSYTSSFQGNASVVAANDGGFVAAWESDGSAGGDTSSNSVHAQRYDPSGEPLGNELQVNSYTTSAQGYPSVAVDADGDFVVVWESYGSAGGDTSSHSIQGQRYDSNGDPSGTTFQVNSYTTSLQRAPSVAVDAEGDFVVVWQSIGSAGGDTSSVSIQGQRFRVTGDVGDRVWQESDGDGVQEIGEPGVPGVAVELYDDVGNLVASTVTDTEGEFLFAQLAPGDYSIIFELPDGFLGFTAQDAGGDDALDSDVDADGQTALFTIAAGVTDFDRDAGVVGAQVGDRVWRDANANGVQNGGEGGVAGVTVRLYREPDPRLPTSKGATLIGTDVTDGGGFYSFVTEAGTYSLEFDCSNGSFTALDQGPSDALDSDVVPATATTAPFALAAGVVDSTRDAGLLDPDADGAACSDNCPVLANADQADADGDDVGDVCDLCAGDDATGDADGDGLCADLDCDDDDAGNACAVVFGDGFESGDTTAWSSTVP